MFCAGQDSKFTVFPGAIDDCGVACWGDQSGDQDIRIDYRPHWVLSALLFATALRPDLADGFVNNSLQLVRAGIRIAVLNILDGSMKDAPSHGVFDELGEVAFFHAPGTQKSA
jgi:hypothetical protein